VLCRSSIANVFFNQNLNFLLLTRKCSAAYVNFVYVTTLHDDGCAPEHVVFTLLSLKLENK